MNAPAQVYLWNEACKKALDVVRPDGLRMMQTGGDKDYAWRVMDTARQIYQGFFAAPVDPGNGGA